VILVDSSVWIDHFRGEKTPQVLKLIELLGSDGELSIGDLVFLEVLQGCRDELHARKLEQALSRLPCFVLGGAERCRRAAAHYRTLRAVGTTPRKSIDVLIATFCIEENIVLLHDDRDFDPMEQHLGLRIIG
jgi:predicted nucleic acid-binding protein